jgi:RNA polymerase sigma-70 factor (ECF subfamily)
MASFPPSRSPDQKTEHLTPILSVYAPAREAQPLAVSLSFQEIFNAHARYLWRALIGLGVAEREADDAVQEVFLVLYRRLAEIDPTTVRSWLYAVCVRVASDHRRRSRARREVPSDQLPEQPVLQTPFEGTAALHLQRDLLATLEELDESKRAAFVLYEIEELTLREVAEALGCPLQTAYSRLEAARTHVRQTFARRGER